MAGELLEFVGQGGKTVYGLAQNLEEDEVGAVLLGDVTAIRENDQVRTTGRIVEVPSGREMLGRVVNPLGMPIDGKAVSYTHLDVYKRQGSAAATTRGFTAEDFYEVGQLIAATVFNAESDAKLADIRTKVDALLAAHPLYPELDY